MGSQVYLCLGHFANERLLAFCRCEDAGFGLPQDNDKLRGREYHAPLCKAEVDRRVLSARGCAFALCFGAGGVVVRALGVSVVVDGDYGRHRGVQAIDLRVRALVVGPWRGP